MFHKRFTLMLVVAAFVGSLPAAAVAQEMMLPIEGDEAALIAILQNADAPLFDKAKACQRLAVIGTKKSVPVLAAMLGQEKLAIYARFALEPIPDPSVDEALRAALGKLEGLRLVGVINSIGNRADEGAVDQLKKLLGDSDQQVAAAAAATLSKITTPECVAALKEALGGPASLRPAIGDACLTACDKLTAAGKADAAADLFDAMLAADLPKHIRIAAARGAIVARGTAGLPRLVEYLASTDKALFGVALSAAHDLPAAQVSPAVVAELVKVKPAAEKGDKVTPHPRHVVLISVLGELGDKSALPVVLEMAQNAPHDMRIAALRALASLGDERAVPVLLKTAVEGQGELSEVARASAAAVKDDKVDAAIVAALDGTQGKSRAVVIELIGQRGISSAVPALLKAADEKDARVSLAAISALGVTIGLDDFPALTKRLISPAGDEELAAARAALKTAALRSPDRDACADKLLVAMSDAPVAAKCELLELLGSLGGDKALATVAKAATGSDVEIQDAATRVLGGWMTPDAGPVLLKLVDTLKADKFRIRALRGYIRIPRQLGISDEEKLAMFRQAMKVAWRDAEKKLVLESLVRIPSPKTLAIAVESLDSPSVKEVACAAAVAISEKVIKRNPAAVARAMERVLESTPNAELTAKAKRLLRRASKK